VFESIVVFFGMLSATGQIVPPGDYLTQLNRTGIFENRAQDSLPQTLIHNIILKHFENPEAGKEPKCLLVGYDGARADALQRTVSPGVWMDVSESGVCALLNGGGAVYNMYTGGPLLSSPLQFVGNTLPWPNPAMLQETVTAAGWTTMLTGRWAKGGGGHGVTSNGITKAASPKLIFTELLEAGGAGQTAFVVSWGGHFADENATYKNDIAYWLENSLNAKWLTTDGDEATFDQTLLEVQDPGAGMVMCILEFCDHAGHGTGFGLQNPDYAQAIKDSERDAYRLIQAVKARPTYDQEDWLILISSDHGGAFTGHGQQFTVMRQIFLAINKPL
jgi:hypothetical protein